MSPPVWQSFLARGDILCFNSRGLLPRISKENKVQWKTNFHTIGPRNILKSDDSSSLLRWSAFSHFWPQGSHFARTKPTSNYKRSKRRDKRCEISAKLMRHFSEQHNAKHFHYLHWTVVDRSSLFLVSIQSLLWFVQIKEARSIGVSMGKGKRKVWFFVNVFLHNLSILLRTCLWISLVREIVFGLLLCFSLKDRITGVKKLIFHHYSYIKNSWSCSHNSRPLAHV